MPRPTPDPAGRPAFLAVPAADRRDAGPLRAAAAAAILLHAAVLLLPFRASRPDLPAPTPPVAPIPLREFVLTPPRVERPPAPEPPPAARRIPVPASSPDDLLEPAPEPVRPDDLAAVDPTLAWDPVIPDGAAPPAPAPSTVDEGAAGLDLPVRVSGGAEPAYPEAARRAGVGGVVVLRAVIAPSGEVVDVEVVRAPRPDLGFSDEAIRAVTTWRYRPGVLDGRPVAVRLTVRVAFDLHR